MRSVAVSALSLICACWGVIDGSGAEPRDETIRALIDQLDSRNPFPADDGGRRGHVLVGPGFSVEREENAVRAARHLASLGTDAFPLLVEHLGNQRYCCRYETPSGPLRPLTVGTMCRRIMASQVCVYAQVGIYPRMHPGNLILDLDEKKLADWWRDRKHKTLRELQLEAFEWSIEALDKSIIRWETLAEEEPDGHDPSSSLTYRTICEELRACRKDNKNLMKKLRNSDAPLPSKLNLGGG